MLKGLGDLGNLMKMQKEMKNFQKNLKKAKMDGESAEGLVKATVSGEYRLLSITVDKSLAEGGDVKKLEKHILTAVNDATEKMMNYSTTEMAKFTGGFDLSSMFK